VIVTTERLSPELIELLIATQSMAPTSPAGFVEDADKTHSERITKPLLDVISCSGADTTLVVTAARLIQADVRTSNSPELWLDQLSRREADASYEPADVVIFVGPAERLLSQRCLQRGRAAAPDSVIAAAITDATFDQTMSIVNQGARGLLVLPGPTERLSQHLHEFVDPAVRGREHRRAVVRHRRAAATLTPAENEVLEAMLTGMPNKQIALRLSIGLRTVELRRSKIMKKMKAKSLAQLISFICIGQQQEGC
jgi:DNA-binding NarL/FixJ family response regulator